MHAILLYIQNQGNLIHLLYIWITLVTPSVTINQALSGDNYPLPLAQPECVQAILVSAYIGAYLNL